MKGLEKKSTRLRLVWNIAGMIIIALFTISWFVDNELFKAIPNILLLPYLLLAPKAIRKESPVIIYINEENVDDVVARLQQLGFKNSKASAGKSKFFKKRKWLVSLKASITKEGKLWEFTFPGSHLNAFKEYRAV